MFGSKNKEDKAFKTDAINNPDAMSDAQYIHYLEKQLLFVKNETDAIIGSLSTQYHDISPDSHLRLMEVAFNGLSFLLGKYDAGVIDATQVTQGFKNLMMVQIDKEDKSVMKTPNTDRLSLFLKESINATKYKLPPLRKKSMLYAVSRGDLTTL